MNKKLLALACLAVLAVTACKRDEPSEVPTASEPPAAAETTAASTAPAPAPAAAPTDAIASTPNPVVDLDGFDQAAFAGRFSGGGAKLELKADGRYVIEDSQGRMDGTWTVEAGNKQIRLDPNTKAQEDRLFAIVGQDELGPLDASGKPASGQTGLRREGSATAAQ